MRLADALGIKRGEMAAFIGAGGKTSAIQRLSHELSADSWRVIATASTAIPRSQLARFPYAIPYTAKTVSKLPDLLTEHGCVFVYHHLEKNKAIGLDPHLISTLADSIDSDVTLIEADGARGLALKVPYQHEPIIPHDASLVVPVAGWNVVGKPLTDDHVYNVEAIIDHYGFPYGATLYYPWLAQILRDEALGLYGIEDHARIAVLLNQCRPKGLNLINARRTARLMLEQTRIERVVLGHVQQAENPALEIQRRVGAIVLAGGLSSRMGQPKPLLSWGHQTVIEAILHRLVPLRFSDVVVVTGHRAVEVGAKVKKVGGRTAHNKGYAAGEMLSSLQTGLRALGPDISAAMVFLGDQPMLNPRLIHSLLLAYATGKGTIAAPSFQNRRGHPYLIDRRYWRDLLELPAGSSPREVINANSSEIAYVLTDDPNILQDMDTPEEYQAALRRAGLG